MKYTENELENMAILDLQNDANFAEKQAKEGPFYPKKNITRETLLSYAKECRNLITDYKNGGLHDALLKGEA